MKHSSRLWRQIILLVLCATASIVTQSAFGDTVRFAAIGDFGANSSAERRVSALVKSWTPDFIISLGDNSYHNLQGDFMSQDVGDHYGEYVTADLATNRFWPSLGNHDIEGDDEGRNYLRYFTLPPEPGQEWYYEFARGPIRFFVLNSATERDGRRFTTRQGKWLKAALAGAKEPIKLVYFHHAPFSSGHEHGSNELMWWPFKDWGATAVLAGHEHHYEHILKRGFHYFTNGLGGDSPYTRWKKTVLGSIRRYPDPAKGEVRNVKHGAMLIEADERQVTLRFITTDEVEIESVTIKAGEPQMVTPIYRTMEREKKGTDVEGWQEFLVSQGILAVKPDAHFGRKTHDATVIFQEKHGLAKTGIVDEPTLAKAKELGFLPLEFEEEYGN